MREISIYIDLLYSGAAACGSGTCSIVLEYLRQNGQIATTEHFCRWTDTTRNRLAVLAMTEALSHIKEPCRITVYINNPLLVTMINDGMLAKWQESGWISSRGDEVKNADLLRELVKRMKGHEITMEQAKETSYTSCMLHQIGIKLVEGTIPEKIDRKYEQEKMEGI